MLEIVAGPIIISVVVVGAALTYRYKARTAMLSRAVG